jgi:hypothetical protein
MVDAVAEVCHFLHKFHLKQNIQTQVEKHIEDCVYVAMDKEVTYIIII